MNIKNIEGERIEREKRSLKDLFDEEECKWGLYITTTLDTRGLGE